MAYEQPEIFSATGNTIVVEHPTLPMDNITYLVNSVVAGATSLTVLDNYPYVQNDFLVFGKLGFDKTEITKVNAAVTQGTALTVTTLLYDHPIDEQLQKTIWDQVQILGGNTTDYTLSTQIVTLNIQADRPNTTYVNTGTTYAYYFARYKNSVTGTFSDHSDAVDATGYPSNSYKYAKIEALNITNQKIDDLITEDFLNRQLLNCEEEVFTQRRRWSWAYTFNSILGTLAQGAYSIALPANITNPNSNTSILNVRIKDRSNMTYLTKEEFDQLFVNSRHSTVLSAISISDTTINITNTNDFDTSGSVNIGTDSISYTGKTATTLTGCTNVLATHAAGIDVWQNISFQEPVFFTVDNGTLKFWAPVDSTFAGSNVYLDFYRNPTAINSDSDTLNIPDFSLYQYFLAFKILLRKNNGVMSVEILEIKKLYEERKKILLTRERNGQRSSLRPRMNNFSYSNNVDIIVTGPIIP